MQLIAKPLAPKAFAPFGDVIDIQTAKNSFKINYGLTTRFHDLANIDVEEEGGKAGFSIFQAQATQLPHQAKVMEYHPYGSQLFYPLCESRFLVLVAPPSAKLQLDKLELFVSNGRQGVNYYKSVWHHYLMPLDEDGYGYGNADFIVIDRIANDNNCVEETLALEVNLSTAI